MDNRKILRTVRISGGLTFKPGQEEQLETVIGQSEIDALIAGKVLSGNWKGNIVDAPAEAQESIAPVNKTKGKARKGTVIK